MGILKTFRNYICYCGIDKDKYKALKKDAYASNFVIWRFLHCVMTAVFGAFFVSSLLIEILGPNRPFYLAAFIYSLTVTILFLFILKKDSIIAQLTIYLSISVLFLFAAFITQNKPELPATTFIVFLLISPMFMVDKPYFMGIELISASVIFLIWMKNVKTDAAWNLDLVNVIAFSIVGFIIHIVANSIRIKEFELDKELIIQKDTDELTGIKNKGAITREINEYLADETKDKGIMFLLDINFFKSVNDTYGHDIGDSVISQFGTYLRGTFSDDDIIGRFGGDEFIVFIKNTDDKEYARQIANKVIDGTSDHVLLPDRSKKVGACAGIAIYHGKEKNYSEIFKKADVALYRTKADRSQKFNFFEEND